MGQLFTWINGEVEKDNKYFEKLFIDENTIINEEYERYKQYLDNHIGDRLEQVRKVLDCYNSYSVLGQREENDKVITKAFNNIYKNIRKILEQKNITNIEYKKAFKALLGQYENYCDSKCSDEEVDKIEQILFMMVLYSYSPFAEE